MRLSERLDINITRLIREISKELGIDETIVQEIVQSEFSFVVKKIREYNETKEDAPILLNFLGKFTIKKNRRKYLDSYKASNDREQQLSDKGDT